MVLAPLGKVEVVVDRPALMVADQPYIHIGDDEAEGYGGLMSKSGSFPPLTAWSRAFVHLARTLEEGENVWIVEDDVAGKAEAFAELVHKTAAEEVDLAAVELKAKDEDGHWPWWGYADGYFGEPCRGFQPLCRLSGRLVREVLDFRERNGQFTFHEVLFPSLARKAGMCWLDWSRHAAFKHLFGTFRYRPVVTVIHNGICHPVKDLALHEAICTALPTELPRLAMAKCEGWSILAEDYVFLSRHCRRNGIRNVAEFGPGDSTLAFLDAGCRVISFEHDIDWLHDAERRFQGEDRVMVRHCSEDCVPEAGTLPFEPEMVFVDGPPFRQDQTMSRLQACEWALEVCGYFLLHDAKREGELATLEEMERRGMHITWIPTRKGLAIVVDLLRRPELMPASSVGLLERYCGEVRESWFGEDFYTWTVLFQEISQPVRVLECGVGDGMSLNLMLDVLFLHPASEAHGIDLFEGNIGARNREEFEANVQRGGHAGQLHLYEGTSREVLAWMLAGDGFWESFDFILLNDNGNAAELLADACQAWSLLKPQGILVLSTESVGNVAVESFLMVFGDQVEPLLDGNRTAVLKK